MSKLGCYDLFLRLFLSSSRCRLLLNSVHEDDSGTYTCKLSTVKGEAAETL